ncbi:MAG TPA: N-acetylmuramic acid 6-phosphate etherase [Pyrinomonadaceae bacterium]|nr:N-acetylmuramic acid 6-phosphate etherase [Pyrinomonadaceae bacterium]
MNPENFAALPVTEQENPRTSNLSSLNPAAIVRLMNEEDTLVAPAVGLILPDIATAVERIVERLRTGGRLFYIGTGTSGRLGVLDASECPPTFGVSPDLVQAVIAGGYEACHRAVEASEDDSAAGARDLTARGFTGGDALVGIAASGRTPYTSGALSFARSIGAFTAAITCAPGSEITRVAEVSLAPVVGPEVLTGSTRLKAGTAQKMILNMLSTATLVQLGYVSGNRMSNLQTGNAKLQARAIRILSTETGMDHAEAAATLERAGRDLRIALVSNKTGCDPDQARHALESVHWAVEPAIAKISAESPGQD